MQPQLLRGRSRYPNTMSDPTMPDPSPPNHSVPPRLLWKRGGLPFGTPDWAMILGALLVGGVLGWLSILRYTGYNAGMLDLGNMAQAIWSGTQGKPLVVTFPDGPLSRLALHGELIYYAFVPLYAVFPDPRLLLAIQAGLFVSGAIPVYRLTMRRTGERFAARGVTLIYLCYPVALTSVLFDFHGDTLAMPLLLFALDALDSGSWARYALFTALALSCKFYVALPVAVLGLGLLLWGERMGIQVKSQRLVGGLTLVTALLYGVVTSFLIRPIFAPPVRTPGSPTTLFSYLQFYFGGVSELWPTLGDRLLSAVVVVGPAILLAWRGWRWLMIGLPLALAMLLSSGPGGSYDFRYHHYALVVPFVIMAVREGIHGISSHAAAPHRRWRADLSVTVTSVLLFSGLLVDIPINPFFWMGIPGQGCDPSAYGQTARDAQKDWFLTTVVPPSVPMAASMFLAPHLANRETLYVVRYPDDAGAERLPSILPEVDYVLSDALFDYFIPLDGGSYGGGVHYERDAIATLLRDPDFRLIAMYDGLLLFGRGNGRQSFAQEVEIPPLSASPFSPLATFGDAIGLITATVVFEREPVPRGQTMLPIPSMRYQAVFDWVALGSASPVQDTMFISRVMGSDAHYLPRIVHLPTYVLLPTRRWPVGHIIRERFAGELPAHLVPVHRTADLRWEVAGYRIDHPYSYATDARSQQPGSYLLTPTVRR